MNCPPIPFVGFPKIGRWSRDVIVTEKIDGTNAQVYVDEQLNVYAGSRNRWLTPEADNFGFAKWVEENSEALKALGHGHHYGEWWGSGIQRTYGLKTKRFSLFNVTRWGLIRPACCGIVPVLYKGPMDDVNIQGILNNLQALGSCAEPGFMRPEGIVVYHEASGALFKKTLEDDGIPKSRIATKGFTDMALNA